MIDALQKFIPYSPRDRILFTIACVGFLISLYNLIFMEGRWVPPDATPIGSILTQGTVKRRFVKSLQWWPLKDEQVLYKGDSIYTPQDTSAVVKLADKGDIHLGPRSLIKFDDTAVQYVDFVLMKGSFEIANKKTKVKIAGKGARILVAKDHVKVKAANKKDPIEVKIQGTEALVGKTAQAINIQLPSAQDTTKTLPDVKFKELNQRIVDFRDETSKVALFKDETFILNKPSGQTSTQALRFKFSKADEIGELTEPQRKSLKDEKIKIIKKPLTSLPSSITPTGNQTAPMDLDIQFSKLPTTRSLSQNQAVINLDASTKSLSHPLSKTDSFLTEQPEPDLTLPDVSLPSLEATKFSPPKKVEIPLDNIAPEEMASQKVNKLQETLETLKKQRLDALEIKKQKSLAAKREKLEAEKQKLLAAKQKRIEEKKQKLLAAKRKRLEAKRQKLLAAKRKRLEAKRQKLLAAKKKALLTEVLVLRRASGHGSQRQRHSDVFKKTDTDVLILRKKGEKGRKLAQASGSSLTDKNPSHTKPELFETPLTARLFVKPFFQYAKYSVTDNSRSSQAKLVSNPSLGIELGVVKPLKYRFSIGAFYKLSVLSFKETTTQTLSQSSTYSEISLASFYHLNDKLLVRSGISYGQRPFLRATGTTSLMMDSSWIFQIFIELIYKLFQIGSFMLDIEGGVSVLLPRTTDFYSINMGHHEYGKISLSRKIDKFDLRGGFKLHHTGQNSSLANHSLLSGGIDFSIAWDLD